MGTTTDTQRFRSGYAVWRLIAEELRADISEERLEPGARLPPEHELAERFGVNRHTVRQGVAALAAEGLIQARRGSGTFVTSRPHHLHRIVARTRLTASLPPGQQSTIVVLDSARVDAPSDVAARLSLEDGTALRIELLRMIDDSPLARTTQWLPPSLAPDIACKLHGARSVTEVLASYGVDDYVRVSTNVSARQATARESDELELSVGGIVLVSTAIDALSDGTPLQYVVSRFPAHRVSLDIEP